MNEDVNVNEKEDENIDNEGTAVIVVIKSNGSNECKVIDCQV